MSHFLLVSLDQWLIEQSTRAAEHMQGDIAASSVILLREIEWRSIVPCFRVPSL
ncbi:hypothetical protein ANRL4_04951 [Anaerolineae bacterium]|nr:hypothetical protein ANRL4_04951 [Anaerolineae bacterium]